MTEILTESFCERCGTRYTFESAAPRRARLGKVRTLSRGMKNFVLSDDSSFSEAMAEARSEQELAAVAHQLDAFHQTFNFCLTCRQYTCGECWNDADGRCLTCAPYPEAVAPVRPAAFAPAPVAPAAIPPVAVDTVPALTNGFAAPVEAWPATDLSGGTVSREVGLDEAESEATAEAGDLAGATDEAPPLRDVPVAAPAAPAVVGLTPGQSLEDAIAAYEAQLDAQEPAAAVADVPPEPLVEATLPPLVEATLPPLVVPAPLVAAAREAAADPGEDDVDPLRAALAAAALAGLGDDATGEFEELDPRRPVRAAATPEPEPEALVAPEPAAAALSAAEPAAAAPELVAAAPEPKPELVAAALEPEPVTPQPETAPAPVAAEPPRVDVVPQPAWPEPVAPADAPAQPVAVPQPVPPVNPWLTVAPENGAGAEPQWPAAPAWPVASAGAAQGTLAGRPLVPQADPSGMWAASAREVLTAAAQAPVQQAAAPLPTAQPCVSCGLSLSANARFCRRCGTRQG